MRLNMDDGTEHTDLVLYQGFYLQEIGEVWHVIDAATAVHRGEFDSIENARFQVRLILAHDLHEPGIPCVDCSNPDEPVETQKRICHPAYRGCVLRPELKESAE